MAETCSLRLGEQLDCSDNSMRVLEASIELQMITIDPTEDQIPEEIKPFSKERASTIEHVKVFPLVIKPNNITQGQQLSSAGVVKAHAGKYGSIAFVTRRPGCQLCRMQALSLHLVAKNYPEVFEGFGLFGLVKEYNVDAKGLHEFQEKYFPYPIYHDPNKAYYQALGNRKVGMKTFAKLNPLSKVWKKVKAAKIKGNFLGEGFLQGGIIIFDRKGNPVYSYEEKIAEDLPVAGIAAALNMLRH